MRRTCLLLALGLAAAAPPKDVLYSFSGPDGATPAGTLAADAGGTLYGAVLTGGANGNGGVFSLTQSGTETLIWSWPAGQNPNRVGLAVGPGGVLYGTTQLGGANGVGNVFSLTPPSGGGAWTYADLYDFSMKSGPGYNPTAPIVAPDGSVLGGTQFFPGAIWKLTPAGGAWTMSTLYQSTYGSVASGPAFFTSPPLLRSDGSLLGDSQGGSQGDSVGTVWTLSATNGGGTLSTLANGSFGGGVQVDARGTIYSSNPGSISTLTPGSGGYTVVTRQYFEHFNGTQVNGGLVALAQGYPFSTVFGTTAQGGRGNGGLLFSLTGNVAGNGAWLEQVVHGFAPGRHDGVGPGGGLIRVKLTVPPFTHALFGVTNVGGAHQKGTVFRILP